MNRLIFVSFYFAPDHSATSQIISDLAFQLASNSNSESAGAISVCAITSQQRYDRPEERLPKEDVIQGVFVHRVFSTRFGRAGLIGRGLDYLSFYYSLWQALMIVIEVGDIIVAMDPPALVSVLAMRAAKKRGALLI